MTDTEEFPEPQRACAAEATLANGCVLVSLYLRHSEGATPENVALMEEVAAFVSSVRRPWIVGMDANMSPDELERTGWPALTGGTLFCTQDPTCGDSFYDLFLLGGGMERTVVGVQKIVDTGTNLHSVVRLLIRAGATRRTRRILKRAPNVPAVFPAGPLSHADAASIHKAEHAQTTNDAAACINEVATAWVAEARAHWSRLLGRDVGDDDQARFLWKQQTARCNYAGDPTALAAAHWRSLGREASQAAATTRHAAAAASRCNGESELSGIPSVQLQQHQATTATWRMLAHAQ
jgi:hypothetical protein